MPEENSDLSEFASVSDDEIPDLPEDAEIDAQSVSKEEFENGQNLPLPALRFVTLLDDLKLRSIEIFQFIIQFMNRLISRISMVRDKSKAIIILAFRLISTLSMIMKLF